jgi:quinol monooxygenase YgiN
MMKNIQFISCFKIHKGKLKAFKKLANACIVTTKKKDKNTLEYNWYFNKKQNICMVQETYTDSKAVLTHVANLGNLLGKLSKVSDLTFDIYGSPSKALIKSTALAKPKFYTFYKGIKPVKN